MQDYVIGIDPGKKGGFALIRADGKEARAWKLTDKTEHDIADIFKETDLLYATITACWIEKVHARPAISPTGITVRGMTSTWNFAQNYGFLRGLITAYGWPLHEVAPSVWQRNLQCLSKGDKNITKAKAQQLFPKIKITHALADALLIAEYGRKH